MCVLLVDSSTCVEHPGFRAVGLDAPDRGLLGRAPARGIAEEREGRMCHRVRIGERYDGAGGALLAVVRRAPFDQLAASADVEALGRVAGTGRELVKPAPPRVAELPGDEAREQPPEDRLARGRVERAVPVRGGAHHRDLCDRASDPEARAVAHSGQKRRERHPGSFESGLTGNPGRPNITTRDPASIWRASQRP